MQLGTLNAGRYAILPAITDDAHPELGLHVIMNPADHFNRHEPAQRVSVHELVVRQKHLLSPASSTRFAGESLNTSHGRLSAGVPHVIVPIDSTETNRLAIFPNTYNWIVFDITGPAPVQYHCERDERELEPVAWLYIGTTLAISLNEINIMIDGMTIPTGSTLSSMITPYLQKGENGFQMPLNPALIEALHTVGAGESCFFDELHIDAMHRGADHIEVTAGWGIKEFQIMPDAFVMLDPDTGTPIGITHAGYPNYRALKVTTCSIISGDKVPTIAVDPACREAIRLFDDTFAQAVADGIETASASGTQFRLHPYFDPPASHQDGQRKAA